MTEQMEQMIYNEGYRRGKEETTTELMAWHDRVCEEMAKRHTADRPMLDDGTLVVGVKDATAVTRVLVEDEKKNGDLYYNDRPKGEWIYIDEPIIGNPYGRYKCSKCNLEEPFTSDFCPNCGAEMKGADNEAD